MKVVNLGLPKTGTTTLARALRRAGFHVADHRIRPRQSKDPDLQNAFVAEVLYKGYFETGDPCAFLGGFDAISEMSLLREGKSIWPQMDFALIRAIRTHHPDVKIIASGRDAFELSQSMLAWSDLAISRLPAYDVPGMPKGFGETTKERTQWIKGHYANLDAFFEGDANFMTYKIEDADIRERLEAFLQRPLPWWGRSNSNRSGALAT